MQKFTVEQLAEKADEKCLPVASCIMAYQRRANYNAELQAAFTLRKILERSVLLVFYNQHRVRYEGVFPYNVKDVPSSRHDITIMAGLANNSDAMNFLEAHKRAELTDDFLISLLMVSMDSFGKAAAPHNNACGLRML